MHVLGAGLGVLSKLDARILAHAGVYRECIETRL